MTCPGCGWYSPPDPETGYDEDGFCADCEAQNEADLAEPVPTDDDPEQEAR